MTENLSTLLIQVKELIKEQGGDSPVASWIFTKEDVIDYPDNEMKIADDTANTIIESLDDYDHIYTEIFNIIDDELRDRNII